MIKDSGERRSFSTGAVRDMSVGKGRYDLMPIFEIGENFNDSVLVHLGGFQNSKYKNIASIYGAIDNFLADKNSYEEVQKLAEHFENGALKYGELNWQKGIPIESYFDSMVRHYVKYKAGWVDEPHGTAFLWNAFCLIWTVRNNVNE